MVSEKHIFAGKIIGLLVILTILVSCAQGPTLTYVPLPSKENQEQEITPTPYSTDETKADSSSDNNGEPVSSETPAPSPTLTQTPVASYTPSPTNTLEPASLILNRDTACFNGASFDHIVNEYIGEGAEFLVSGRITDESWWKVENAEDGGCWVYGEYVTIAGGIDDLPVLTPPPLPTLTPTTQPSTDGIYYILISENTGGPFGCGDSLNKYYPGVWVNGDMDTDITAALNALFSNHNQYVNGLSNPMYKSQLKAKGVEVVGNNVKVYLAGNLVRPKNACESKRMHDQVWYTVAQFSPSRAVIYLGNALLGDLLVVAK